MQLGAWPFPVFLTQDLGSSCQDSDSLLGVPRTVEPLTPSSGSCLFLRPTLWAVLFSAPACSLPPWRTSLAPSWPRSSSPLWPCWRSSRTHIPASQRKMAATCMSFTWWVCLPGAHVPLPLGSSDGPHASSSSWTSDSFRRQILRLSKIPWDLTAPRPLSHLCPWCWLTSADFFACSLENAYSSPSTETTQRVKGTCGRSCACSSTCSRCTSGWWLWMDSSSERSESWGTMLSPSRGLSEAAGPTLPLLLPGTSLGLSHWRLSYMCEREAEKWGELLRHPPPGSTPVLLCSMARAQPDAPQLCVGPPVVVWLPHVCCVTPQGCCVTPQVCCVTPPGAV